jgi:rhodanese-related sulfurtransferase
MRTTKTLMAVTLALALALALAVATPVALGQQPGPAAGAAPAPYVYKYQTPKLNRSQIDALLAKPEQLLLIDLRRPDELTRIGGFPVYLSIQSTEVEKSLAFIPRDRSIVTLSNHAGRAGAAADLLASKGFKVVGAVGVQNYEEEGGRLTRVAPLPAPPASSATAAASRW